MSRNLRSRITHHRHQPVHFVRTAPRKQRHDRTRAVEAYLTEETFLWLLRAREIDQRMADELDRHAGIAVERFFEGKNHQHAIGDALHRPHPVPAPGPELRADVVNDRDAQLLDRCRQPEIEIGEIDDDQRVGLFRSRGVNQPVHHGKRARHDAKRFDEAGHADAAVVGEELASPGHQTLTAKAENGGGGIAAPNFDGERAGVQVA